MSNNIVEDQEGKNVLIKTILIRKTNKTNDFLHQHILNISRKAMWIIIC